MFFPREAPRGVEIMVTASSSSQSPPEHRSSMKPRSRVPLPNLKPWANQRLLKCVRLDAAETTAAPPPNERRMEEDPRRIEPLAAALAEEKRPETAPAPPIEDSGDDDADESYTAAAVATCTEDLPWNLRTRRSTPASNGKSQAPLQMSSRSTYGFPERRDAAARRRRPKFSLPLTKEEIDEDLYAFTGRLPARRPRKRPRSVQKQMDMLFPGVFLSEVTVEMYQVADPLPPPPP